MHEAFSLTNTTKSTLPLPRVLFQSIKNFTLGENYELSLVFVAPKKIHELNLKFRGKDNPTNILSFPLDKKSGEIFICLPYAKKEVKDFGRTYPNYIAFLFIHGLIHLKGFDHGSRMESEEEKIRTKFGI